MNVLVMNSGSSSVKYQLFDMKDEKPLAKGMVERIGLRRSRLIFEPHHKDRVVVEQDMPNHKVAVKMALESLTDPKSGVLKDKSDIAAVGHRVVHGAEEFSDSVLIDTDVTKAIKKYAQLAPLHNPPNLAGISGCRQLLPKVPQVAVFDTAYYHSIPRCAYLYGLPYELYEKKGIRRYGFHGTSHRYVNEHAAKLLKKPKEKLKTISCHMGNGCSVTATKYGKAIETSMGFTPLEGVVMGTRSGNIDPAIIIYMIETLGMTSQQVNETLNKKSGLLGISGLSSDMRDIYKAASEGNERARTAFDMFVYSIQKYIGAYSVILDGIDALIFTGGIGENHAASRDAICKHLKFLGLKLDAKKNKAANAASGETVVSSDKSSGKILVIPTNEELMIARDTYKLITKK